MSALKNYRELLSRVDELCNRTASQFSSHLACRPGCDSCCRHLSVTAVEAAAIFRTLKELPPADAGLIRDKAKACGPSSPCPLLHDGLCLLYRARPIICRTHGLPLLIAQDGENRVDFCPENFRGVAKIPGSAVIDLERLNAVLTAVNALYLKESPGPERVGMAELLLRAG